MQQELFKQYKVLELDHKLTPIRRMLVNDASGKAQKAADARLEGNLRLIMGTNRDWGLSINGFGYAGMLKRIFG